jgi:hypothetical protein
LALVRVVARPSRQASGEIPSLLRTDVRLRDPVIRAFVTSLALCAALTACGGASPPAHVAVQRFHGQGHAVLGTVRIPVDSTIHWRYSPGGIFIVLGADKPDGHLIAIDPATSQTSGVEPVPAGTYSDVEVETGEPWSLEIVPDR